MSQSIVQTWTSHWAGVAGFGVSGLTPGHVLIVRQWRRQGTVAAPTLSPNGVIQYNFTDLIGSSIYAARGADLNGIGAWAVIIPAGVTSGTVYYGSNTSVTINEVSGAAAAVDVLVPKDQQASSSDLDIGSLGTVASGVPCFLLGVWGSDDHSTVTHTGWTREFYSNRDGTTTSSDTLVAGAFPFGWFGKATGAGAAIEAEITLDGSYTWGGVAFTLADAIGPVASFTVSPGNGSVSFLDTFTDTSTGSPTSWAWDFGDGGTSTSQNPTHTYTVAGVYTVTLTATNAFGSSSASQTIHAYGPPAPGVYIDWDDDGFDSGAYDLVTSDVMGWVINRGDSAELTGGSQPGSCTLTLKNLTDRYNPENTSSPIYLALRDGARVWIAVNDQGRLSGGTGVNGLFAGRITDITPIPAGGADEPPTVEIVCEDALGWYGRRAIQISEARDRSQADLRLAALTAASETRYSLPDEPRGLPLSSYDGMVLGLLEGINTANGTRHFAKPADNYIDWYAYTARNRWYKVGSAADGSLVAGSDHVTDTTGWRKTASVVINEQKASFTPITFPDFRETVWQAESLPIIVHNPVPTGARTIWVEFDDFVTDVEVEISSTTSTTATITGFGRTAKIELSAAPIHITRLVVTGRKARRALDQSIVIDDAASQDEPRGIRAGSEISGDLVGSRSAADGIARHIVWRFAQPQYRPGITVQNWLPDQFSLDLLDLISFTSSQIGVTDRLFEIVGLTHTGVLASDDAVLHIVDYTLQECRVQSETTSFTWDSSLWDGDDAWAYF